MFSTKRQSTAFLDLPFEIRTHIYTYVLDRAFHDTWAGHISYFKVLARTKIRLLRVNKLIYSEALPVFYKHHHICLPIQNLFSPPPSPILAAESRFDLLIHLELMYEERIDKLDVPESDISISNHLRFVQARCPNLKSLRLELRPTHPTDTETRIFCHHPYRGYPIPIYQMYPYLNSPADIPALTRRGTQISRATRGMTPHPGIPSASRHYLQWMDPRFGIPAAPVRMMPGTTPGYVSTLASENHVRGMTPLFNMLPGSSMTPGMNSQPHMPRQRPSPPPRITHHHPSPPPPVGRRYAPSFGTYLIDKHGASVQSLKEIWCRLENLTISIPEIGDFGDPGFQQYMCEHFVDVAMPDAEWKMCIIDYEGESMSLRGTRTVEWSVSKE